MIGRSRVARAALAAGMVVGGGSSARATTAPVARVDVVRPPEGDDAMQEVATRAWAELTADGIAAELIDRNAPSPQWPVQARGAGPGELTLTVATFRRPDGTVTEVEVRARGRAQPIVKRAIVIADEVAEPKLVAIRAVELVHATLLDPVVAAPPPTSAPPPARAMAVDTEQPTVARSWTPDLSFLQGWSLAAGVTEIESFGGLGSAFGAELTAGYRGSGGLGFALRADDTLSASTINASESRLFSMRQRFATLEATLRFRRDARVRPEAGLGVGVYHVHAAFEGSGIQEFDTLWGALFVARGGASLALVYGFELAGDAAIMFADPHPAVQQPSGGLATAADPSLVLSLGLRKTF